MQTESSKVGPWTRLSSTIEYENPWIKVEHQNVITPGGTEGIYGLVHFKNIALAIVPIDENGNTRLVGQYRYALDAFSWEVPMGGGDLDGSTLVAAQRELKEETGLTAEGWKELMRLHTSNSVTDEEAVVYLATDLSQGEQALEASENDLIVKSLPFSEAFKMVLDGEITDAVSVAAIFAVERELRTI